MAKPQWEVSSRNGRVVLVVHDHISDDVTKTTAIEVDPHAISELVNALREAETFSLTKWPVRQRHGIG